MGSEVRKVNQNGGFELSLKAKCELQCGGGEKGFYIMRTACMLGKEVKKRLTRLTADTPSVIQILLLRLGGEIALPLWTYFLIYRMGINLQT